MNKRSLATLISGATLLASAAGCNNPKGVANANDSNAADTAAAANVSNAPATAAVSPTPMQPTANSNLGTVVAAAAQEKPKQGDDTRKTGGAAEAWKQALPDAEGGATK
ncbi:MAG: hypothetical protein LC774_09105 [Acidobacteria bacterium]|nr:hypothetical protein [Acidobacteriota bacterium]